MKHIYLLIVILVATLFVGCQNKKTNTTALQVEMQENPQGVSTMQPRFTWQITSDEPNTMQKSYQIHVATTSDDLKKEQNLLWDSGIKNSDKSHLITYDGKELATRGKYYWRIRYLAKRF